MFFLDESSQSAEEGTGLGRSECHCCGVLRVGFGCCGVRVVEMDWIEEWRLNWLVGW